MAIQKAAIKNLRKGFTSVANQNTKSSVWQHGPPTKAKVGSGAKE
jgi:hypothetical protein